MERFSVGSQLLGIGSSLLGVGGHVGSLEKFSILKGILIHGVDGTIETVANEEKWQEQRK